MEIIQEKELIKCFKNRQRLEYYTVVVVDVVMFMVVYNYSITDTGVNGIIDIFVNYCDFLQAQCV